MSKNDLEGIKFRNFYMLLSKKEMVFIMEYNVGDIVKTKKAHPCGSKTWEIIRIGIDFKLKCQGCEHIITLERQRAIKIIKKVETKNRNENYK